MEREEGSNGSSMIDSSLTNDIVNFVSDCNVTDVDLYLQAVCRQVGFQRNDECFVCGCFVIY